jgi:diguanylate cyclase (GGDEF)-like protein
MTGLFNFRHFKEQLDVEHARASRYTTPYSVVFMDIDHFKRYNDQNGHPAGDALLKEIAQIIRSSSRVSDVPARYGGEEFAILCKGVNWEGAMRLPARALFMGKINPMEK